MELVLVIIIGLALGILVFGYVPYKLYMLLKEWPVRKAEAEMAIKEREYELEQRREEARHKRELELLDRVGPSKKEKEALKAIDEKVAQFNEFAQEVGEEDDRSS